MPKISEEDLQRVLILLFKSDLEFLTEMYGTNIGVSKAVRTMVRTHITQIKAKANKTIDEIESKTNTDTKDLELITEG